MIIGGRDMTPPRAVASMEDLIALAHAVHSGTLEADTKAFMDAAKRAEIAEAAAQTADTQAKARETAIGKREKAVSAKETTLANEKALLKSEVSAWGTMRTKEEQAIADGKTQLAVAVRAVKEREDRATAKSAEAQTVMDAAEKIRTDATALKSQFEGKMRKLRDIA